jgi:RND family efflux transporter MFP subunit
MKRLPINRRLVPLVLVLIPLLALFVYVGVRSGPLAPVLVTAALVEERAIAPALFGIGTVESRYTYKIGPTTTGRVLKVDAQVGDTVRAGQGLAEMDPIDLDERIGSQNAAVRRADANMLAAASQVEEASARMTYANTQAERYEQLLRTGAVSEEVVEVKRQERAVGDAGLAVAHANLDASREELTRVRADQAALMLQRANLRLVAPVAGLVSVRNVDPGATVVPGQAVVEVIDPTSLWMNVRFDQLRAAGLKMGLPAGVVLRSRAGESFPGRVARVEPMADAVTEEILAKIILDTLPFPLPPVGELVEVTVALPALPSGAAVPNASIHRVDGRLGVWLIDDGGLRFATVAVGAADLDGWVQIVSGLTPGQRLVVYSHRALSARNRIKVVDRLPGTSL